MTLVDNTWLRRKAYFKITKSNNVIVRDKDSEIRQTIEARSSGYLMTYGYTTISTMIEGGKMIGEKDHKYIHHAKSRPKTTQWLRGWQVYMKDMLPVYPVVQGAREHGYLAIHSPKRYK